MKPMTIAKLTILGLLLLLAGPALAALAGMANLDADWRTASRQPTGIAPDPATTPEAVVQVYGARAFNWRGAFAVHTWIAVKPKGAEVFAVHQVMGWSYWHGGRALVARRDRHPDRLWYGAAPEIYLDRRGPEAEALIDEIEAAIDRYPYAEYYKTWPGPNSNTFVAYVGREVPALRLELPPTAVGKDFLGETTFAAASPSGTGFQVSLFGLFGILAAVEEGLEITVFGLTFGVDPLDLAIKMPGIGRLAIGEG